MFSQEKKKKQAPYVGVVSMDLFLFIVAIVFGAYKNGSYANDPWIFVFPNLLLFTPFCGATELLYKLLVKHDGIVKEPQHILEIFSHNGNFSFEELRSVTNNFRHPAVVRGLFLDTPALKEWHKIDYLKNKLGDFSIPVVKNGAGYDHSDRGVEKFGDAIQEVLTNKRSLKYLFFPVNSRVTMAGGDIGRAETLRKAVDKLMRDDFDLDRIWRGFGTPEGHGDYRGSQIIIGQGRNTTDKTTGSAWHCAPGNNYFIQVAGTKRWYFMDQKYSAWMLPRREGINTIAASRDMAELQKYLPRKYADIRAGDMLYNPDWEWHTIKNFEGLSIGVPLREFNRSLAVMNNWHYSGIALINNKLDKWFGVHYGFKHG